MKLASRHSTIKRKAEIFDLIIDQYNKVRKRKKFPRKIVQDVAELLFPEIRFVGRGFFKQVYSVKSRAHTRVLKISNKKSTDRDWEVYSRLPSTLRNRHFAKVYWRTKYCSLQKYGEGEHVPADALKKLKQIGKKYGLTDIKADNVRRIDGRFKIVDANPSK